MGERGITPTSNITRIELAFAPLKPQTKESDRVTAAAVGKILGGDDMMRALGGNLMRRLGVDIRLGGDPATPHVHVSGQTKAGGKKGTTSDGGSPLRG